MATASTVASRSISAASAIFQDPAGFFIDQFSYAILRVDLNRVWSDFKVRYQVAGVMTPYELSRKIGANNAKFVKHDD
jgi:hypothetical protein